MMNTVSFELELIDQKRRSLAEYVEVTVKRRCDPNGPNPYLDHPEIHTVLAEGLWALECNLWRQLEGVMNTMNPATATGPTYTMVQEFDDPVSGDTLSTTITISI